MSRTGVGIRVTLDGRQVDDGCIDWASPPPDAIDGISAGDGLRVVWGRPNSIDQPSPSTCTFRIFDDPGGETYYDGLRVGSDVRVYAEADSHGAATLPTFLDPGFETGVRGSTANATLTRAGVRVDSGAWSAQFQPIDPGTGSAVILPPAAFEPSGGDPAAWDAIRRIGPGETWAITVRVWVPRRVTVRMRTAIYSGPYANAVQVSPTPIAEIVGAGAWATLTGNYVPGDVSGWLGVQLSASPDGWAWNDVPPAQTWNGTDPAIRWDDFDVVYIDNLNILAPTTGAHTTILVFQGRVSDLAAAFDSGADAPAIDVTAADFLADLGNRFVGNGPWDAESLTARVGRVLTLATIPDELPMTAAIAPTLGPEIMTWEDVQALAAAGLLTDMSTSVDGVLWSATHIVSGPYIRMEDPAQRPAMYTLKLITGVVVIVPIDPATLPIDQRPLDMSACDILRDPVTFVQDNTDISTRVSVEWQEQTIDPDTLLPAPTSRTYTLINAPAELERGTRATSVQTMLTTVAAAARIAERVLARQHGNWRATGLTVADADFTTPDATAATILLTLLDGVKRGGQLVRITDLPAWSPLGESTPGFLEGGEYEFTDGGWILNLTVSPPTGIGKSATWNDLGPTWTWNQFDPAISWDDLRGVSATP